MSDGDGNSNRAQKPLITNTIQQGCSLCLRE